MKDKSRARRRPEGRDEPLAWSITAMNDTTQRLSQVTAWQQERDPAHRGEHGERRPRTRSAGEADHRHHMRHGKNDQVGVRFPGLETAGHQRLEVVTRRRLS
jgi:hypothetical protein